MPDMGYTRSQIDKGLSQRLTLPLTRAHITVDPASPVAQFSGPIAAALNFMRVSMADPTEPADGDLVPLDSAGFFEVLDIAEAEILTWATATQSIQAAAVVQEQWPDYSYRRDSLAIQFLQNQARSKMDFCRSRYGYGATRLRTGTIDLGFQATTSDDDEAT